MMHRSILMGALTLALSSGSALAGTNDKCCVLTGPGGVSKVFDHGGVEMDAPAFFELLVDRYRAISTYRDSTHLVQITERPGEDDVRLETSLFCEVTEGELRIVTPQSQIRDGLGLSIPWRRSAAMDEIALSFQLWLAPHMAVKFREHPLRDLREGVQEGFTPTLVERVSCRDRELVHLKLKSGDELSGAAEAVFDFFIDPDSLLIERIESVQLLSDGSRFRTLLEILPEPISHNAAAAITG